MIQGPEIRDAPGGTLIPVRVRPRSKPAMVLAGGQLIISVAAPPAEGRASEEARRSLAGALEVPPSTVSMRTGPRSRDKVFFVSGLDAGQVRGRLRSYRPIAADPVCWSVAPLLPKCYRPADLT